MPALTPSFLESLPLIAYVLLGVLGLIILWFVWRNLAPAAPGVSLGYYEIIGRYAGQKLFKRLRPRGMHKPIHESGNRPAIPRNNRGRP